jgi:CheY-like chemotaxis protein
MALPCILVIDDDHDTRVSLRDTLEMNQFCVCSATNGKDALDLLSKGKCRPSLILLDLMMPVMNGWDFFASLKKNPEFQNIPILVTSAVSEEKSISGAAAFVPKPINLSKILELIAQHRVPAVG